MSEQELEPCWGPHIDTDHLADVLRLMADNLDGDEGGIGLQGVDYSESAQYDEFVKHELVIQYSKGGDTILGDPIRFEHNMTGGDE